MEDERLEELLHSRIKRRSGKLFADGHYADACHRGLEEVAAVVKEKTGVKAYGRNLRTLFTVGGKGLKLRTPFGDTMQQAATWLTGKGHWRFSHYASRKEGDR